MNPFTEATIEVSVRLPGSPEPIRRAVTIAEDQARCLRPLPRGREIPFNLTEQRIAAEMATHRRQIAQWAAETLTKSILEALEARDPQMGYSPEEWAELHRK